jgi:outer membrane receptor protein involved in Fe transport
MKLKVHFCMLISVCFLGLALSALPLYAQETTGGLQGTVKDPSGAVVPRAHVVVTGSTLVGSKEEDTDGSGYYRFANLPPGNYTLTVTAKGFSTAKREGVTLEVGHLPSINITLSLGVETTVVEVTATAPVIDVTTNLTMTNVGQDVIENVPHGQSYQSVIQFAPMARNEPLAGGSMNVGAGGTGGMLPGSSGNGLAVGFSIGGAADSENAFLVEGQDTENISGGVSQANVPFQFIQEVQVKTSGIEAEHGGALGGVVNVIMKKGSNGLHGQLFTTYEADGLDGSANGTLRYDPNGALQTVPSGSLSPDAAAQTYLPKRDHFKNIQPGFTVGGPILKDRLWFFLGFAPQYTSRGRTVNFAPSTTGNASLGNQIFTQDNQQYFTTARLDAALTQKIRVFGSWLYQYTRESGADLPHADSVNGLLNTSVNSPLSQFSHGIGFSAPNATYNLGADISITPKIVATTRFGYFFNNYHDFGWPTAGVNLNYSAGGSGVGLANCTPTLTCTPSVLLPGDLQTPSGTTTAPYDAQFTEVNANKHYQFNQDVAFFKSGWWGTHNFKFGYQLNHLSNVINQHGNVPEAFVNAGNGVSYGPSTALGGTNCGLLEAQWGGPPPGPGLSPNCTGQFGYVVVQDFATVLKTTAGQVVPATDWNHGFFVQDSWTMRKNLTFNLGVRVEKETLPAPAGIGIANISTINFGWGDKIAPRLGVAWDPTGKGTMKIFASYGVTNDVMKLLLAQSSWGAQGFETCAYPLGPNAGGGFSNSDINLAFNSALRACPTGVANVGANFAGGTVPKVLTDGATGVSLIENVNFRPEEPVVPGLKPYRQHEYVAGVDYRISKNYAFEARYDHRALDHVIEDASLADPNAFEIYNIVNPGEGVNRTIDGYAAYLKSLGAAYGPGTAPFNPNTAAFPTGAFGTCPTCPPNPKAIRTYDGLEFRVTKSISKGFLGSFAGMFSYTWSRLYGNYTGLTTTEQTDGGVTGRNSPDTTRSFDEPFYYFGANGQSNNGVLPTDRPNTFKGNVYYELPWKSKRMTTTLGLFQVAYQGSPVTSWADVGLGVGSPIEGVDIFGRGMWANATTDSTGHIVLGTPFARRTPWYTQSDLNLAHSIKVNSNNESQVLTFNATFLNVLNQHSVTSYWGGFNSDFTGNALLNGKIFGGAAFYQQVETGYNAQASSKGVILNSQYGQPNLWQISRSIRLGASFRF